MFLLDLCSNQHVYSWWWWVFVWVTGYKIQKVGLGAHSIKHHQNYSKLPCCQLTRCMRDCSHRLASVCSQKAVTPPPPPPSASSSLRYWVSSTFKPDEPVPQHNNNNNMLLSARLVPHHSEFWSSGQVSEVSTAECCLKVCVCVSHLTSGVRFLPGQKEVEKRNPVFPVKQLNHFTVDRWLFSSLPMELSFSPNK